VNNYTNENIVSVDLIKCRYLIVGAETAPETGTQHLQGYCYFENAKRFSTMKNMLPAGTHLESAKGTAIQNQKYCSKENVVLERGDIPSQGKRTDLVQCKELIEDGANMRDIIATASSTQTIRAAEKILSYFEKKRDWKPEVVWLWGESGTGKTKLAQESCTDPWWSGKNLKWWQGYDGHEDVILDDFRGDFCTFHELLRILDRYPYTVEVKGGSRQLLAKRIIITCPYPPDRVYHVPEEQLCQLIRRITTITELRMI